MCKTHYPEQQGRGMKGKMQSICRKFRPRTRKLKEVMAYLWGLLTSFVHTTVLIALMGLICLSQEVRHILKWVIGNKQEHIYTKFWLNNDKLIIIFQLSLPYSLQFTWVRYVPPSDWLNPPHPGNQLEVGQGERQPSGTRLWHPLLPSAVRTLSNKNLHYILWIMSLKPYFLSKMCILLNI